jgi:hypothetical protein
VYGLIRFATINVTMMPEAVRLLVSAYGATILWQALVAGAIGYGLANYVPESNERRQPTRPDAAIA